MMTYLVLKLTREDGQSLAEYGLIIALTILVAVAALTTLGTTLNGMLARSVSLF